MNEKGNIEQPDMPDEKNKANYRPEDFGYKKFEPTKQRAFLEKAKAGGDKDSEDEVAKLEKMLDETGEKNKELKPKELQDLDRSVVMKEDKNGKKKSDEEVKALERAAFSKTIKTLESKPIMAINIDGEPHVFEFKAVVKNGKEMKPREVQKILEHIDKGEDVPPNIEFQFSTSFQKGKEESNNEKRNVNYFVSLRQIMSGGVESTLHSLFDLTYDAAGNYDRSKKTTARGKKENEAPQKKTETERETALNGIKKQLTSPNIQTSSVKTPQWSALEVSLPEKKKQFSIVYDGDIFQLTEKRLDKSEEIEVSSPSEIIQYIEKASK